MTEPSTSLEIHTFKRTAFLTVVRLAMLLVFSCLIAIIVTRVSDVPVVVAIQGGMRFAAMIAAFFYCPMILYFVNSGLFPSAAQRASASQMDLFKIRISRFIFGCTCLTIGYLLTALGSKGSWHGLETIVWTLVFAAGAGVVLIFPAYMASWGRDVPVLDDKASVSIDPSSESPPMR